MLKALYIFLGGDPKKHKAVIEAQTAQMTFVGVGSFTEAEMVAKKFVDEGGELIELCGAFGYEGARLIQNKVGENIPVGIMVHQVKNAPGLDRMLSLLNKTRCKTDNLD